MLRIPVLVWHRLISPGLPPSCRFYPSCGEYALQALDHFPWWRALGLIAWRLVRCNPFHPGGYDPLPGMDPTRTDTDLHGPTQTHTDLHGPI